MKLEEIIEIIRKKEWLSSEESRDFRILTHTPNGTVVTYDQVTKGETRVIHQTRVAFVDREDKSVKWNMMA